MTVIAQIIGIIGMINNVISFAMKKQKTIIVMQFAGSILFCINMLMLDAVSGGLLNGAGIIRGIVFMNKRRLGRFKNLFVGVLIALYVTCYILSFTVFGKELTWWNLTIEFLPLIAMIFMTFGYAAEGAKKTRIFGLLNSPPWLIYNISNLNIGGTICEVFCISSIIFGMLMFDRKEVDKNGTV